MNKTLKLPQAVEDALLRVNPSTSRRSFLKSSGALVIAVGINAIPGGKVLAQAVGAGPYPDPDFLELDTWILIHPDNTATFFVGKTDGGQGTGTAFRQMMCDELDIAYDKTSLVMGSTDATPDQGGSGGSDAIERDGWPMRRVAAEARRVMLELASEQLGTPVDELTVSDATVSTTSGSVQSVTYAELVGGKRFDVQLKGDNIKVNALCPGAVNGELMERVIAERATKEGLPKEEIIRKNYTDVAAMRRWVEPEEVATTALAMASDPFSAITGESVRIDCGRM